MSTSKALVPLTKPEPNPDKIKHYRIVAIDREGDSTIMATLGPNRDLAFDVLNKLREDFAGLMYKIQSHEMEAAL